MNVFSLAIRFFLNTESFIFFKQKSLQESFFYIFMFYEI